MSSSQSYQQKGVENESRQTIWERLSSLATRRCLKRLHLVRTPGLLSQARECATAGSVAQSASKCHRSSPAVEVEYSGPDVYQLEYSSGWSGRAKVCAVERLVGAS